MYLFQKEKNISEFFFAFFKCASIFEDFPKKMTLVAYVFPKGRTAKDMVR